MHAIYLFFATTGLRRSEVWNLTKDDVDSETRCIKAKHYTEKGLARLKRIYERADMRLLV